MEIKLVYSLEEDLVEFKKIVGDSFKYSVYDENSQKDYKKASLLKYTAGAKLTPFIAIYRDNIMYRCFYQEDLDGCMNTFNKYFGDVRSNKDIILEKLDSKTSHLYIDDLNLSCVLNTSDIKKHIINEIKNAK